MPSEFAVVSQLIFETHCEWIRGCKCSSAFEEGHFLIGQQSAGGFHGQPGFDDVLCGLEALVFGLAELHHALLRVPERPAGAAVGKI